jgi:hypothetical protein
LASSDDDATWAVSVTVIGALVVVAVGIGSGV